MDYMDPNVLCPQKWPLNLISLSDNISMIMNNHKEKNRKKKWKSLVERVTLAHIYSDQASSNPLPACISWAFHDMETKHGIKLQSMNYKWHFYVLWMGKCYIIMNKCLPELLLSNIFY